MPANARSHAVLTTESKVTIRGQTTIPAPVREALKLKPGQDSIHYEILPGGQVFMCRLGDEQEDHTMNAFLRFLDADIQNNPQKTRPLRGTAGRQRQDYAPHRSCTEASAAPPRAGRQNGYLPAPTALRPAEYASPWYATLRR